MAERFTERKEKMKEVKKVFGKTTLLFFIMMLLCGLIYTLVMTGISQLFFKDKANGSIIEVNGVKYGSELLGQQFTDPAHMWGRIMFLDVSTYTDDEGNPLSTKPYTRFEEGQSTSAIWAVRSLGIDPASGEEMFIDRNGYRTYVWNVNDQVVCGEANPKFQGNFGFNAEWRGLAVNCSFAYKAGGEYYNQTLVDRVENVDVQWNVDRRVFTGTWKEPGDRTFFKRVESTPTQTYPTSRFVEKSNELSLSSLNVSYDFKRLNVKRYVERLKIAFYMTDVFRVSTVKAERGLEYPFARTCSFSLQATF